MVPTVAICRAETLKVTYARTVLLYLRETIQRLKEMGMLD